MDMNKRQIPAFIIELLEYARLAPSVHNTQPWHFKVNGSTVSLIAASDRFLKAGDPTQRELWISLGVCLETLLQAARGLGLHASIQSIQTDTINHPIANITFTPTSQKAPDTLDILKNRHSYRGAMQPAQLPALLIENCRSVVSNLPGVSVSLLQDKVAIKYVAGFTYKGMRLALSSSEFRKELAELINYNWSSRRIGMHGFVLNHGAIGSIWEKWSIALGLDTKRKARVDQKKVLEASGLIFISTTGDVSSFWLNAGRAYMRVAMEVTKSGFAQSTLAAPIEAASFHEDIEKILQTTNRIQAMIRIGKPAHSNKRTSPRLSVDELLT